MAEYIEREAALRKIERCEKFMVGDKTITTDAMKTFIKNRPAVDVAPVVHAQWIHQPDCGVTRCSHCGWSIEECWESKRCPNCGAKMDGGDGNEAD